MSRSGESAGAMLCVWPGPVGPVSEKRIIGTNRGRRVADRIRKPHLREPGTVRSPDLAPLRPLWLFGNGLFERLNRGTREHFLVWDRSGRRWLLVDPLLVNPRNLTQMGYDRI